MLLYERERVARLQSAIWIFNESMRERERERERDRAYRLTALVP
jgi:hypothetical protein